MIVVKIPRLPFCRHRVTLCGLNLERFLNAAGKAGIPLRAVRRQDGKTLECECCSADLCALCDLAQEKGWKILQSFPCGLSALLCRLKRRPGLLIGLILAFVTAFALSQFVWKIEIHNAGPYLADISAYLSESGYAPGTLRSSVNAEKLEQALTYRYPQLTWFRVYVSNVTLVVDVIPGIPMPELPSKETGNVVAACDGIVDSIQVYAGTAAVKPGDVVRKGQLLILGQERSADGQFTAVCAEGMVMARCWHSCTVHLPLYEMISEETGAQHVQTAIVLPWFRWPSQWEKPSFLAWNTYLSEIPLGGAFLPFVIQRAVQKEVSMEYAERNVDEVRQEAAQAALKQLKTELFGDEIIDKWVDYCMIEDDTLAATVTAERLVDIGEFSSP